VSPAVADLSDGEYAALAELRHHLRRFLAFSETQARAVDLEPRQHQVLLALRGLPADATPTVGALAERLLLRHHTVVELIDRLEKGGLVRRDRAKDDRRQARITLTRRGRDTLRRLSISHRNELGTLGPALVTALRRVLRRKK
jgi:DNA-binding MarR family transcriptional regulator